jgi:glyoxylase-like metal-dependent hydrolase (beta-lactamase superfamily II)
VELLDLANRTIDTGELTSSINRVTNRLTEVADGLAVVESFSHVWVVSTPEGLVLFDVSSGATGAAVLEAVRAWSSDPVHTIVYTHGHVDHVGGASHWMHDASNRGNARPRVVAHRQVKQRLDRYRRTNGYNLAINARQFAPSRTMALNTEQPSFVPAGTPDPDLEYDDDLEISVGGERFVLHHGRGETDDHTWTEWVDHDTLFVGDFLTWNFPNCGNPQKVLRYPAEWAINLRRMIATAPQLVAPAHGLPVQRPDRVARVLGTTAEALEGLTGAVIDLLNADATLDDALHTVRVPDELLMLPWLRPFYDEPEFVIHNLWRTYGGWWDGNPAHILPPRQRDLAREVVAMSGGLDKVVAHATGLAASGDLRTAAELIEMAVQSDPSSRTAHAARVEIYAAHRRAATSLMAKGIFEATVRDSAERAGVEVPDMRRAKPGS